MEHEALRLLFRNRPALAAELLQRVLGVQLPAFDDARLSPTDLTEVRPAVWHADLVVELRGDDETRGAVVVEVQRSIDARKRFSWPIYVCSVRAALECPVSLLVVATDPSVARWAREPIELGPGAWMTPMVLALDAVPAIEDVGEAMRDPELAVLSAVAHGGREREEVVALAALRAVAGLLDEDRRRDYVSIVLAAVSQAVGRWLEEQMSQFQGLSEVERRIEARGEVRGRRDALLRILATRHIEVSDGTRTAIDACTDVATLDRWIERAISASADDEILD